ncbi:MAG: phosphomethylpyrimidine synthase ThiC, partial [Sulfurospirillum cavolei]|nr:phosphomethylpyrimidine synthase ThiC [Sulfurospirillum cavolei]
MSKVLDNLEKIDSSYIQNFPSSRKIYIQGSRADIQVPMREIELSPTAKSDGTFEENPPLHVYDTSGVYTDPNVKIDLHQGLKPIRAAWIEERN